MECPENAIACTRYAERLLQRALRILHSRCPFQIVSVPFPTRKVPPAGPWDAVKNRKNIPWPNGSAHTIRFKIGMWAHMGQSVNLAEETHMGIDILGQPGALGRPKMIVFGSGPTNGDELCVFVYHSKELDFPSKIQSSDRL